MLERRGTEFDPTLLDLFFTHLDEMIEIEERLKDDILRHHKDD
jgi:response regulator RpfG family c-di-GMP phosphodiesterase